jgi:TetR/AcrR family transcriptional repressor of nem operon
MTEATTQKERTRARILDEAARAMRAHGSEGIGVAALMKRAGLTHGGFYAHFDNRDDLVAHAIDRMFKDSSQMLDRTLGQADVAAGLRTLIDYYLSDEARASVERGCPMPGLSGEAGRMPAAARARFGLGATRFRSALERALTLLGSAEPAEQAASVLAELVGAMALARAVEDDEQASAILRASREQLKRRVGVSA